jgi:sulfopyruvate decarboxylase subunit beta
VSGLPRPYAQMDRVDVLRVLANLLDERDLLVTIPSARRHLREINRSARESPDGTEPAHNMFAPVILGSVSSTALGLALALPHRRIVSLDTDGSLLMNSGILATMGNERAPNLTVVVLDNEVYESIGPHRSHTAGQTDLARMAEGAGCINCCTVHDPDSVAERVGKALVDGEFGFVVTKIRPGGLPAEWREPRLSGDTDGIEDKYRFIRYVESLEEGIAVHDVRFW